MKVKVLYSFLTKVVRHSYAKPDIFGDEILRAQLQCAVCQAKQRVSKFMFPAATKCLSNDWTLEFGGFSCQISTFVQMKAFIKKETGTLGLPMNVWMNTLSQPTLEWHLPSQWGYSFQINKNLMLGRHKY